MRCERHGEIQRGRSLAHKCENLWRSLLYKGNQTYTSIKVQARVSLTVTVESNEAGGTKR